MLDPKGNSWETRNNSLLGAKDKNKANKNSIEVSQIV